MTQPIDPKALPANLRKAARDFRTASVRIEGDSETADLLDTAADALESIPSPLAGGVVDIQGERGSSRDHDPATCGALERAIYIAAGAHNGQIDKGGAPHIQHVLRVVRGVELPEDKVVAALHDLLEDCPDWDQARLRQEGFSETVMDAVVALTRGDDELYDHFIARVAKNPIARRVKLADLADNSDLTRIRNPGRGDELRVSKYARAIVFLSSQTQVDVPKSRKDCDEGI